MARISGYLDKASRMKLMHQMILSNVDFCNSIFYGLPNCDLRILQVLINSAARIVVGLPRFSHERITPVLIDLHILPIKARIKYKICLLVHKALSFGQPRYLTDLLHVREVTRDLRASTVRTLEEPIISRSLFSNRCFSYCAPRLYNSLPVELRNVNCVETFKKRLKTFIFSEAYDVDNKCITPAYSL